MHSENMDKITVNAAKSPKFLLR